MWALLSSHGSTGDSLTWLDVMAAACRVCWFCSFRWFSEPLVRVVVQLVEAVRSVPGGAAVRVAAAGWGRMAQIKSPETMPQDDRVWPVSDRSSEPFRDKLNSVSALRDKQQLFDVRDNKDVLLHWNYTPEVTTVQTHTNCVKSTSQWHRKSTLSWHLSSGENHNIIKIRYKNTNTDSDTEYSSSVHVC